MLVWRHFSELAFGLMWLALIALRLETFGLTSRLLDCDACLVRQAWPFELQFLAFLLVVHIWSSRARLASIRYAGRLLLVFTFLIALIDAVVIRQFYVRLHLHEFLKFITEPEAALEFLRVLVGAPGLALAAATGALLATGTVLAYVVGARQRPHRPGQTQGLRWHGMWALPLLMGMGLSPLQERNVHSPFLSNAVMAFIEPQTRHHAYRPETPVPPATDDWAPRCVPGLGQRPNIILLVVESLSSFQSKAWGGHLDWWPQLDALQGQGLAHMQFMANGITTEDGLVALLSGSPPIPRPDRRNRFEQFSQVHTSMPRMLARHGYQTAFMTSGDLGFLDKGDWLRSIGFKQLQGHDHPEYQGLPRFHFQAPPDEALYRRALHWMRDEARPRGKPFFLTIETVSTHQPYIDPRTGQHSMERAFRYADEQLGAFVRVLRAQGYFEHGVLIVTGDHRAMVPVSTQELQALGQQTYSRIPMLAIGAGIPAGQILQTPNAQTDLLPSLEQLVSQKAVCTNPSQALALNASAPQQAACIVTRRAYDLDQVFLQCGQQEYTVELDAERTRTVSQAPAPGAWLDWIERQRRGAED